MQKQRKVMARTANLNMKEEVARRGHLEQACSNYCAGHAFALLLHDSAVMQCCWTFKGLSWMFLSTCIFGNVSLQVYFVNIPHPPLNPKR